MRIDIDTTAVLSLALANLPTMVIVGIGILYNNSRISDLRAVLTSLIENNAKLIDANARANAEALNRVEGVIDARLRHIEDKLNIGR